MSDIPERIANTTDLDLLKKYEEIIKERFDQIVSKLPNPFSPQDVKTELTNAGFEKKKNSTDFRKSD